MVKSRKKFETDTMAEQPYAQENQHSSGRKTYKETTLSYKIHLDFDFTFGILFETTWMVVNKLKYQFLFF